MSAPAAAAALDPVLVAMREELERSKAHLKMENIAPPYYIEYSVSDLEEYDAEAAFGALRQRAALAWPFGARGRSRGRLQAR